MQNRRENRLIKPVPQIAANTVKAVAACVLLVIAVIAAADLKVEAAPPNDSDKITIHLEFLGYKVETTKYSLKARHPNKFTLYFRKYEGGCLIYLYAKLKEDAKTDRLDYLEFINRVNAQLTVARAIAQKKDRMKLESWFPGVYEKESFSLFFEEWNNDLYRNLFKDREGVKRFLQ